VRDSTNCVWYIPRYEKAFHIVIVRANRTIDDVAAIIGFSATVRLIQWHGGSNVYVPGTATPDHPLAALMGEPALRALVDEFGDQTVWVPNDVARADIEVKKSVAKLVLKGRGSLEISTELGISQRQVQRIRRELEDSGLLPKILGENALEKSA
jgi:hypothetical protein